MKPKKSLLSQGALPVAVNRGGRPRKPTKIRSSIREQLEDYLLKRKAKSRVIFCLDDADLLTKIAGAPHGKRGLFVMQMAAKKGVSKHTIWRRIPEIRRAARSLKSMAEVFGQAAAFESALQNFDAIVLRGRSVLSALTKELRDKKHALVGINTLDIPAAEGALALLRSHDISVSEYADIVSELERLGNEARR
jgi:hypothetical protein